MEVLIYLIPVALLLGLLGLVAFMWSLRSGQFEDMEGAANRILFDDELPKAKSPKDQTGEAPEREQEQEQEQEKKEQET